MNSPADDFALFFTDKDKGIFLPIVMAERGEDDIYLS